MGNAGKVPEVATARSASARNARHTGSKRSISARLSATFFSQVVRMEAKAGSARSVAGLTHASAGLPDEEAWIMPTATPSLSWISRPKWYATAEKPAADSGLDTAQRPPWVAR